MTAAEILEDAGLAESHWGARIVSAEQCGGFTRGDVRDALDWPTCACGRIDPRLPRNTDGAPLDLRLLGLGGAFYADVFCNQFAGAATLLVAIEHRAADLLAEAEP